MADDIYWQLEKEYASLTTQHDLIVRVIEYVEVTRTQLSEDGTAKDVNEWVPCKVYEFKVKRDVLAANSTYFRTTVFEKDGQGFGSEKIDGHEDEPGAVEVWLKLIHGCDTQSTLATTSLKGVWDMLATAHRYEFDPKMPAAKAWFVAWYEANKGKKDESRYFDFKDYQSLLFPCHAFDYAEGFQQASRYLAYRATGHITECKPEGFTEDFLRLDANIMHQVNAAKGRLKTILHRACYNPIETLLRYAKCPHKAEVLYAYELALHQTGAWPLESAFLSQSVHEIINQLAKFHPAYQSQMCGNCGFDFRRTVVNAVEEARKYFDGLCLDCMDASKPKLDTDDQDYWNHTDLGVPWDKGCRIRHDQPTWYSSFLGRKMKMTEWVQNKRGNGRGRNGRGHNGRGRNGRGHNGRGNNGSADAGVEGLAGGVAGVQINE